MAQPNKGSRTLLQNVQKQLESPQAQQLGAGQMTDQTERASGLLRAKLGKAGSGGPSPRISAMKEKAAVSQAGQLAQRQQLEGALKGQQLEQSRLGLEAKEQQASLNIAEQHEQLTNRFSRESENIIRELERGEKKVDMQRDVAKLEQLGFSIRMQNKEYISNLQREGAKKRLDDKLSFNQELARQQFKDDEALTQLNIDFSRIADMNDREFNRALADMDINYAKDMAHQAHMQEIAKAKYGAMGALVQGGTQASGANWSNPFNSGASGEANVEGDATAGGSYQSTEGLA